MSLILALAYVFTAYNMSETAFIDEVMPNLLILGLLIFPMSLGLYFIRSESAAEKGAWALLRNENKLTRQEKQTAYASLKAFQQSLWSAGCFFWFAGLLAASAYGYPRLGGASREESFAFILFAPLVALSLYDGFLVFFCRKYSPTCREAEMKKSGMLSFLCLILFLYLLYLNLFSPPERSSGLFFLADILFCSILAGVWKYFKGTEPGNRGTD